MNNGRSLNTLRTLAAAAERESSRLLAQRRQALDTEDQRLAQLRDYLSEYTAAQPTRDGIFIDSIRARRDFVAQICAGIKQQEQIVASLQLQLEQDQQNWRDARSHALALERYDERLQAVADEKQSRREQARLDEVGRQQHLARIA